MPDAHRGRLNWSWVRLRLLHSVRCRRSWVNGDRAGHKACVKCGVWRWFPMVSR